MRLDSSDSSTLLQKRKRLRRELVAATDLRPLRIAVLGGSTTNEVVDLLELLLLESGFRPDFYQSDYGRYYEDAVVDSAALVAFAPELVYIHTSCMNVQHAPALAADVAGLEAAVAAELSRLRSIWQAIDEKVGCQIVQNNFERGPTSLLGSLDSSAPGGRTRYLATLNMALADEARRNRKLLVQDVDALSARVGLRHWFDWHRYYAYKILTTPDASLAIARSLNAMVRALYGKSKKCLVLDLDNTLWGGVIGDDGVDKIKIGRETGEAEAYTAFQEYCLALRNRGVVLAVCSKNEDAIARSGFGHPDSVLKLEHFAAFRANWLPKHENILSIAAELNLGVDSFVFVDDNPAERALVAGQLPSVAVPEVGSDASQYIGIVEAAHYFESVALSAEDLARADAYALNSQRTAQTAKFANYGEYLASLQMVAEIDAFHPTYLDRIAQLINKTNQFNLTTRRYTLAEVESLANDAQYVTLYGRLADTFGDNGLISIIVGRKQNDVLELDLWLMSCRVLKRDMELAMLDGIVARAQRAGLRALRGTYKKTAKNAMVADHYEKLGFTLEAKEPESEQSTWTLDVARYEPRNRYIRMKEHDHG